MLDKTKQQNEQLVQEFAPDEIHLIKTWQKILNKYIANIQWEKQRYFNFKKEEEKNEKW